MCGMVSFYVEDPPRAAVTCFCSDCRRSLGHLGQLVAPYETEFVAWHDTGSQIKRYVITNTESGQPNEKLFCGNCGCTLALIPAKEGGKVTMLRLTLVDEFKKEYLPQGKHMEALEVDFLNGLPPANFV